MPDAVSARENNKASMQNTNTEEKAAKNATAEAPKASNPKGSEPYAALNGALNETGRLLGLFPAVVFSAVVILLVRTYSYTRPVGRYFWSPASDDTLLYDSFSYFKMLIICLCAAAAVVVLLLKRFAFGGIKMQKSPFYAIVGAYALTVALSYLLSDDKALSLLGSMDRWEGTVPIFCYLIMLVFITVMVKSEKDLKTMLWPLGLSMALEGCIGIRQAAKNDIFRTVFGQKLITPLVDYGNGVTSWTLIDKLAIEGDSMYSFKFNWGEVYQTVYNTNYVPFYICLILPLFAMIFVMAFGKGEKKAGRMIAGLLALAVFAAQLYSFFGARAASGYFGLVTIFVLGLIVFRKKLVKWIIPLLIIALVSGGVMYQLRDKWFKEVKAMLMSSAEAVEMLTGTVSAAGEVPQTEGAPVFENEPNSKYIEMNRIVTGENYFTMRFGENTLAALLDGGGLSFCDSDGDPLPMQPVDGDDGRYFAIMDERFHDYTKAGYEIINNDLYVVVMTQKTEWRFRYAASEGFKLVSPANPAKEVSVAPIPQWGFEGHYGFGSNRGYIWSRTIPLLKSRILWGEGADCFSCAFPQEDYAGKYSYMKSQIIIVDKPHNMYLLNAVNTGCVSMLAFMGMIGFILIDCLRHSCRLKGLRPLAEYVGSGAFLGLAAFAVVGMLNDTSVSVSPLFYSMLGLAFACNRMVEAAENEE